VVGLGLPNLASRSDRLFPDSTLALFFSVVRARRRCVWSSCDQHFSSVSWRRCMLLLPGRAPSGVDVPIAVDFFSSVQCRPVSSPRFLLPWDLWVLGPDLTPLLSPLLPPLDAFLTSPVWIHSVFSSLSTAVWASARSDRTSFEIFFSFVAFLFSSVCLPEPAFFFLWVRAGGVLIVAYNSRAASGSYAFHGFFRIAAST